MSGKSDMVYRDTCEDCKYLAKKNDESYPQYYCNNKDSFTHMRGIFFPKDRKCFNLERKENSNDTSN